MIAPARTGLVLEKKSINLPMVNGILMDTEDETSNKPMAIVKGFRSGFASANIFRKEDALWGALLSTEEGNTRDRIDGFDGGTGAAVGTGGSGLGFWVE